MSGFVDGAIVRGSLDWDSHMCWDCGGNGSLPGHPANKVRHRCERCKGTGKVRANLRPWGRLLRRGDDPRAQDLVELYDSAKGHGTGWDGRITREATRKFWRVEWSDGVQNWVEEKNLEVIAPPDVSQS